MRNYKLFISSFVIIVLMLAKNAFACGGLKCKNNNEIFWTLFFLIISGIIGYVVGTIKSFREEKQKAYREILAPILKMAYHPENTIDEKEFGRALSKLWLYSSKKVAKKMDHAISILHDHNRGDITKAFQEAVVEMRMDIQIWPWQKLSPEDVNHLYTKIVQTKDT